MTSGVNFWDSQVWSLVTTLTILFAAMMIANALRNSIGFLRRLLIPSSVLGGFLLLLVNFIYTKITGGSMFAAWTLETLTYHGLGLGFVAMALRTVEKPVDAKGGSDVFDTGVTVVATYLLQGALGIAVSLALCFAIGSFPSAGLLLPMGYGQGPGQAYNWGHNFEVTYGFAHGTSFGLTVAAMGFVAASIGGVIYLNRLRRKKGFKGGSDGLYEDRDMSAETITGKGEIPLSESMDKLTIQIAFVFITYFAAYLFMMGINAVIDTGALGDFGYNTVQPLVWGFNFLFGTIFAILFKQLFKFLHRKNLIKRKYSNNFMQNRIAGVMFDIMVVASIAAIDLSAFRYAEFVLPLILICTLGAAASYFYLAKVSKALWPSYRSEAFLSLYGMLTGTASTGIILLRETDPGFKSPAANNLVFQQPWAILFGFPMLLLLNFAPKSTLNSFITLGLLAVMFFGMNIILFRRFIFKKRRAAADKSADAAK